MSAEELKIFIETNIPTFQNLEIIENGTAYHYTSHYDKILELGKFLGAPIDENLDKTQITLISPPASSDPGVIFAYLDISATKEEGSAAKEEGFNCDIIEINFSEAVKATHIQEASIGAPDTVLILNTDITYHKKIG